jgi:hypothetical protein
MQYTQLMIQWDQKPSGKRGRGKKSQGPGRPSGYKMEDWKKEIVHICNLLEHSRKFTQTFSDFVEKIKSTSRLEIQGRNMKVTKINKNNVVFLQDEQGKDRTAYRVFDLYKEYTEGGVRLL